MARYRLKRKTFGVLEAAGNTLGNVGGGVLRGVGGAMNSTIGKGIAGYAGWKLGSAFFPGLGLGGKVLGAVLGSSVMGGLGKGLKNAGSNMQQ